MNAPDLGELTRLLKDLGADHDAALDALLPLVHGELKRLAASQRRRLQAGDTLQTTALVNEAWFKFTRGRLPVPEDRQHFFALAARAMRQILVDDARRRHALRHGGQALHAGLDEVHIAQPDAEVDRLLDIDRALKRLEELSPRLVQVVNCLWFAGYTEGETAEILGVTDRTVRRDWVKARAWLSRELAGGNEA
jgi:RNA polymerase sigma factor (TIGR02999 family)